jgi:hypothetical protein
MVSAPILLVALTIAYSLAPKKAVGG